MTGTPETPESYALRALVAAGHVTQHVVDQALAIARHLATTPHHGGDAVDNFRRALFADLGRCLDDVATEMRARGRDDRRFTQLRARLDAIATPANGAQG